MGCKWVLWFHVEQLLGWNGSDTGSGNSSTVASCQGWQSHPNTSLPRLHSDECHCRRPCKTWWFYITFLIFEQGSVVQTSQPDFPKNCIDSNPSNFVSVSVKAMSRLQQLKKNNLVYKFPFSIAQNHLGSDDASFPLKHMPFGLVNTK